LIKYDTTIQNNLVSYYKANPNLTLIQLHKQTGISLYHIRKILDIDGIRPIRCHKKHYTRNIASLKHEAIVAYRLSNPCLTLQSVGDKFGITREGIRQILKKYNVRTRHFTPPKVCANCGTHIKQGKYCSECSHKLHYVTVCCNGCGKMFEKRISDILSYQSSKNYNNYYCSMDCYKKNKTYKGLKLSEYNQKLTCANCGKTFKRKRYFSTKSRRKFCSFQCWLAYGKITTSCSICGEQITRRRSQLNKHKPCCSRKCVGLMANRLRYGKS